MMNRLAHCKDERVELLGVVKESEGAALRSRGEGTEGRVDKVSVGAAQYPLQRHQKTQRDIERHETNQCTRSSLSYLQTEWQV